MKIIIEVKDTATLSRIEEFYGVLKCSQSEKSEWVDVIKSISKEW